VINALRSSAESNGRCWGKQRGFSSSAADADPSPRAAQGNLLGRPPAMGENSLRRVSAALAKVFPIFRLGPRLINASADAADPRRKRCSPNPAYFCCGSDQLTSRARDLSQGPLHPRRPTSDRTWPTSVFCHNRKCRRRPGEE